MGFQLPIQLILTVYFVNSVWTLAQSHNPIANQAVTSNVDNDEGRIRKNIKNVFNFAAQNDIKKSKAYQEILQQETAEGQQNFDKMKKELWNAQFRNANKKRNLYKRSNTGVFKRETYRQRPGRQQPKKLPIGITNIREILKEGYIYVDKTGLIYDLIVEHTYDYFMMRPKGFGKTLFLSTLEEIFKGNKELFEGTAIYRSNYNWLPYVVLRFDFSQMEYDEPSEFENALKEEIKRMSTANGIVPVEGADLKIRLKRTVEDLSQKSGARVVILVDEYDAPVTNNMVDPKVAEKYRFLLSTFFAAIVELSDVFLQFTFVTGVHEYSIYGQGSGKNRFVDITLNSKYATLMGFTKDELENNFANYDVSASGSKIVPIGNILDGAHQERYHRYRFSDKEIYAYNPSSILAYLRGDESVFEFHSGQETIPYFLKDRLLQDPRILFSLRNSTSKGFVLQYQPQEITHGINLEPFLFHMGFLTIRGFNMRSNRGSYELDFRSEDVKKKFFHDALEGLTLLDPVEIARDGDKMKQDLAALNVNSFVTSLCNHISKIPVEFRQDATLDYYRAAFYLLMENYGCETEMAFDYSRTKISNKEFVFKLTFEQSAESALTQIVETPKNGSQEILCVGINFSKGTSNINDWKAKLVQGGEVVREFP